MLTSPPTATTFPPALTALGAYDDFSSKTRWLSRIASTELVPATKAVSSDVTVTDLGCDSKGVEAGLYQFQYTTILTEK